MSLSSLLFLAACIVSFKLGALNERHPGEATANHTTQPSSGVEVRMCLFIVCDLLNSMAGPAIEPAYDFNSTGILLCGCAMCKNLPRCSSHRCKWFALR
jgi:hypothetical protein